MLILPKTLQHPVRNPAWTVSTPNELYKTSPEYQDVVASFRRAFDIKTINFLEVRITQRTSSKLSLANRWWDDPYFMEKIFWVFDKPYLVQNPQGFFQAYYLEPLEYERVQQAGFERFGNRPFADDDAIMVPCDCCNITWDETSAGISDHIRYRPEEKPTQEEQDFKEIRKEEIREIQKDIVEISTREEFLTDDERRLEAVHKIG